jgi:hypothetical protein
MTDENEHEHAPEADRVATEPEQVAHTTEPHHEVASTVAALTDRVSSLESVVQGLLPENRDETPSGRPWTHRNVFKR